ncbi:hypothetical protein CDAR_536571 [Caerostris darwini]|uniref:Uncharacterized protein n=1 Tax=Caerostris darwini TaxID=1538125 RepID=A0AAV4V1S1_9ARAC|nr:hypothetical protein CDAR_536571 [Caerostris darwini]
MFPIEWHTLWQSAAITGLHCDTGRLNYKSRVSCMRVLPLKNSLWGSLSGQRGRFLVIDSPARTDDHRVKIARGLAKWPTKGPRQAFRWPNSVPFIASKVDLCLDFAYRASLGPQG